jgi:site-specific DNA-methyltransferase (adenine-specific)
VNRALFSSKSEEWRTPDDLFDRLHAEFRFTLDVCATAENARCARFFTKAEDGLAQDWSGNTVFMNPPYGQTIARWIEKASGIERGVVVCLLPARTDTTWFHDFIYRRAEIRFLRGRLRFSRSRNSAPFPSMIVIFRDPNRLSASATTPTVTA